jgi:branched-chain amino acid transport system permease protein
MTLLWQTLINGIGLGSIYLLASVGLVLVFSVLKIVNFAHGALLMVAGYLIYIGISVMGLGPIGTSFLTVAGLAIVGLVFYLGVIDPALRRPQVTQLVVTFAVAMFLENLVQLVMGAELHSLRLDFPSINILGAAIYLPTLVGIGVAALALLLLQLAIKRTVFGIMIRAVAEDSAAASVAGIKARLISGIVFLVSVVLSGLGGLSLALTYSLTPHIGIEFTLKAFAIAVLAGMGNIGMAAFSALLLGIGESLIAVYFGVRAVNILTYGILITVLVVRPSGLMKGEAA